MFPDGWVELNQRVAAAQQLSTHLDGDHRFVVSEARTSAQQTASNFRALQPL
jgi:hypothetical protein